MYFNATVFLLFYHLYDYPQLAIILHWTHGKKAQLIQTQRHLGSTNYNILTKRTVQITGQNEITYTEGFQEHRALFLS